MDFLTGKLVLDNMYLIGSLIFQKTLYQKGLLSNAKYKYNKKGAPSFKTETLSIRALLVSGIWWSTPSEYPKSKVLFNDSSASVFIW